MYHGIGKGELTDFNRITIHFTFNVVLERQQSNVNGIFQLQLLGISLLQKGLGLGRALANGRGLPGEIAARGVNLVQHGASLVNSSRLCCLLHFLTLLDLGLLLFGIDALVPAGNQHTDAIWSNTS